MTARVHANESKVAPTSQGMGRVVGESKDGSADRSSSQQWAAATATKRVQSPARKRVSIFINHKVTQIVITLFVVYALFGEDIRVFTEKPMDTFFDVLAVIALMIFIMEIVLQSI